MKNNRVKISQSQLARLVENNVNENTGGVGNLSTDDQANIGMGSSKLVTKTHMNKPAGRLNIMGGTNPQQFKEGGRKEPQGMSYKKEMMGEYKSSERLDGNNIVVIWPSREAQQEMSGRLDQMGLELPDGWEPGMVCTMCECPAGSGMAMWINGCPCDEEEIDPFEWMNENSHNHVHSDQQDLYQEDMVMTDVTCINKHGECGKADTCAKCADMGMAPDGKEVEKCYCSGGKVARKKKKKQLPEETNISGSMTHQAYHEPKDSFNEETECKCQGGVGCCAVESHCPEGEKCVKEDVVYLVQV